jgi:hypothetical protein
MRPLRCKLLKGGTMASGSLTIVGAGQSAAHLTVEALSALKMAQIIFDLTGANLDFGSLEIKAPTRSLMPLYKDGAVDQRNYDDIKVEVLQHVNAGMDVLLLVQGHPLLGVTLSSIFNHEGYRPRFISGISSFDSMITDLRIDPLEEGTVLLDVNRFILYNYVLDPCINHFFYHICSIGNQRTNYSNPTSGNMVDVFRDKLLRFYDGSHPAVLVSASISDVPEGWQSHGSIGELGELLHGVTFDSSLFIPARLPEKSRLDLQFLSSLTELQDV